METVMMLGKAVAAAARTQIEASLAAAKARGEEVTLAIVTVGADPASQVYKNRLVKMTEGIGAQVQLVELAATATQSAVEEAIIQLNQNPAITGILPMMPLPPHLNADAIGAVLAPAKDVDCLSPLNAGELYLGHSRWAPCTARACMATLAHYEIALQGKNVVVLGRSNVVGKPVALLLLRENATVTICHSRTTNLPAVLRSADIIVAAVGIPGFIQPEMVKEGVVIVDVGINATAEGICGDVAPAVAAKASAFTPVPGGIGVVSNMMVMEMLSRQL